MPKSIVDKHAPLVRAPFNPAAVRNACTKAMLRTWDELETLSRLVGRPEYLYCSQGGRTLPSGERVPGYLERKTGYTRETVCRAIAGLCALGVIRKTYRRRDAITGRWRTCLYFLVPLAQQWRARLGYYGALAARFAAKREAKRRAECARAMREHAERIERERARAAAIVAWHEGGRIGPPPAIAASSPIAPSSPSSWLASMVDHVTGASPKRGAKANLSPQLQAIFAKHMPSG